MDLILNPSTSGDEMKDYRLSLYAKYESLWNDNQDRLRDGNVDLDTFLENNEAKEDSKRGYTLIIRPGKEVSENLVSFLESLKEVEPEQHYYLEEELHFSVLSVEIARESCPVLSELDLEKRCRIIEEEVSSIPSFTLDISGITCSSSCVLAQGFPETRSLEILRSRVMDALNPPQRYMPMIAHSTIVRFKKPLANPKELWTRLNVARGTPPECEAPMKFGSFKVTQVDLVKNNWYLTHGVTELIRSFKLKQ
eukprot:Nk52_evm112s485 gene=Nk52_evmTU112s485